MIVKILGRWFENKVGHVHVVVLCDCGHEEVICIQETSELIDDYRLAECWECKKTKEEHKKNCDNEFEKWV